MISWRCRLIYNALPDAGERSWREEQNESKWAKSEQEAKTGHTFCILKDLVPDDARAVLSNRMRSSTRGTQATVTVAHVEELSNCFRFKVHVRVCCQDVGMIVIYFFFRVKLEVVLCVSPRKLICSTQLLFWHRKNWRKYNRELNNLIVMVFLLSKQLCVYIIHN